MRSERDVDKTIDTYADMVQRICICHLKNRADMEDLFQTVFIKYMTYDGDFTSEEHRKAWLIRVTVNACRDYLRRSIRQRSEPLEMIGSLAAEADDEDRDVLAAVLALPEKYKDPLYLHYFEGYRAAEIADMLGSRENTIYSLLSRGRDMLRKKLGGGIDE